MDDKRVNIAIIGIGNLGKRHLEATMKSTLSKNVYCVDINEESKMICEALSNDEEKVFFSSSIKSLPEKIDVAVIATSSNVRRAIFEELINHSTVKYIIFEKVLFTKVEDYFYVKEKLEVLGIKAWVNCARREWDSYHKLKKEIDRCREFELHMSGANWGLGCNGVHMLDLVNFFEGTEACKVTKLLLDSEIVESKRSGYKEIFGTIVGEGKRCKLFSVTCYREGTLPSRIDIIGDEYRCSISENDETILVSTSEENWKLQEKSFPICYQSQLTNKVIEEIYERGDCKLTKYNESMRTHLKYIEPLINYFEEKGLEKGICPIT